MHKAWSSIKKGALLFLKVIFRKFQGYTEQKNIDFDPNWASPDCNLKLKFTDGYEMMHRAWRNIEKVPYCSSRSSIKFQGYTGQKINDFDMNWALPNCNSSLNSPMALKWCTKLVEYKRCPIVFQGHPSNFKVTRDKKSTISFLIQLFRTVAPIWIHPWLWNGAQGFQTVTSVSIHRWFLNDAQSLM